MRIPKHKSEQCNKNLYDYLRSYAEIDAARPYMVTEQGMTTYGEALETVESLAAFFMSQGLKKGSLVALRATRNPDTILLTIALGCFGAVAVMTDPHVKVRDYVAQTGVDIRPDFYLTNEDFSEDISAGGAWKLIGEHSKSDVDLRQKLSGRKDFVRAAAKQTKPDDPFMIIFTSGSTGKAKAVLLSHKNCIANPVDAMPLFEECEKDRAIALLPFNHVFGFAVAACATFCGHGIVFPTDTNIDRVLWCIEKFKITCIYAVPTFFMELLRDGRHTRYDLSSLRLGLMAGAPFTAEQMRYIEGQLGLRLMPGYGMSECVGISTCRYADSVEERSAGVGRLYPMTEARLTDEEGNILPTGQEGEVCVRGMTLMLGYYNDESATREVIDKEGWMHTGDLGYFDCKGILHISGRKKEIIIRNGNNLSAVEIEKKICSLPHVYMAAVVGVSDENCGEIPCAAIVLEKGCSLTVERITELVTSVLNKLEMPEKIIILPSIPLTGSGKIDKQALKDLFKNDEISSKSKM